MIWRTRALLCEHLFVELLARSYLNTYLMNKIDHASPSQPDSRFFRTRGGKGAGYVVSRHSMSKIECHADANEDVHDCCFECRGGEQR
jgi:hypothetical protein